MTIYNKARFWCCGWHDMIWSGYSVCALISCCFNSVISFNDDMVGLWRSMIVFSSPLSPSQVGSVHHQLHRGCQGISFLAPFGILIDCVVTLDFGACWRLKWWFGYLRMSKWINLRCADRWRWERGENVTNNRNEDAFAFSTKKIVLWTQVYNCRRSEDD